MAILDRPRFITEEIADQIRELQGKHLSINDIASRIGQTPSSTAMIMAGEYKVGDPIPREVKLKKVRRVACVTCDAIVDHLPNGEQPCLACRLRGKI